MKDEIKVLIVDDDPDVLFATSRVAASENCNVLTASNGQECLGMVKRHLPDLVLLDVVLPDKDGYEVCNEIKSDPDLAGIHVIMISGMKTSPDEKVNGLDTGADDFIARPISNRELKAKINAMTRILTAERERDRLVLRLQEALDEIKQIKGLIPICSHCKKIRDDKGFWNQIEAFVEENSKAEFSHGICPDCAREQYPDVKIYEDN